MDFWKVVDGMIRDDRVLIDVIGVMRQLGVDPSGGEGWRPPTSAAGWAGEGL